MFILTSAPEQHFESLIRCDDSQGVIYVLAPHTPPLVQAALTFGVPGRIIGFPVALSILHFESKTLHHFLF